MNYIIDSFPVPICQNIRINRCRITKGKQYRGYTASMRTCFYGIKVQLVTMGKGIPIAFHFTVGKTADVKALDKITEIFPPEAKLYGDSAYTDYQMEDLALVTLAYTQRQNFYNFLRKSHRNIFVSFKIFIYLLTRSKRHSNIIPINKAKGQSIKRNYGSTNNQEPSN